MEQKKPKEHKELSGYFEMNIKVGEILKGVSDQAKDKGASPNTLTQLNDPVVAKQVQEMALASINDGYESIVYNFYKNGGTLSEKDTCHFKGYDLEKLWNESEQRGLPKFGLPPITPNFKNIKQYSRLTLICDDPKIVHQIINISGSEQKRLNIINSYDLLAVRTAESEQIFEQVCTKSDVDIISLDLSQRLNYFITKILAKQATKRGIKFEICYGSGCFEGSQANRRMFLQNAIQLVKVCKGKGIIISSDASNSIYQRSPLDAIQIGLMAGMKQDQAIEALRENPILALKHAHMRKTYKGVAELVDQTSTRNQEEEKMQL